MQSQHFSAAPAADSPSRSAADRLTGLASLQELESELERVLALCRDESVPGALIMVSLRRVRVINELYGFAAGDEVLKRVGAALRSFVPDTGTAARISGSKFAIVMAGDKALELYRTARRLARHIDRQARSTGYGLVEPGVCIGACAIDSSMASRNIVMAAAHAACHEAGKMHGSNIQIHEPDPMDQARRYQEAMTASYVVEAVSNDLMQLAFQPVVDAQTGEVRFHEALVRMGICTGTAVPAGQFVPLAEKMGFVGQVDRFALRNAVRMLARYEDAVISVNVSNDSVETAGWLSLLAKSLDGRPHIARRLIVEITESKAASDFAETRKFAEIVRSLGCRVAIDDFGAGYTCFSNLRNLPIDLIKVDGSFAANLQNDRQNSVFIRSLLMLAGALNIETVVEWVEDPRTARTLAAWGVDYLQGHQFGKAQLDIPWEDVAFSRVCRSSSGDHAAVA